MSVPTLPQDPFHGTEPAPPSEVRLEARLDAIEEQVERGNREGRRSGRAFMFFAVTALGIALVNLIAVAAKLDGTSTPARASRPAATQSAAPAAAPVAARRIGVNLHEYAVAPTSTAGKAGRVTFAVRNTGAVPHEFVVLRTAKPAGSLLKGARAD